MPYQVPTQTRPSSPVDEFMYNMGIEDIRHTPESFWLSLASELRGRPEHGVTCANRLNAMVESGATAPTPGIELIIDLRSV